MSLVSGPRMTMDVDEDKIYRHLTWMLSTMCVQVLRVAVSLGLDVRSCELGRGSSTMFSVNPIGNS